MTISPLLQTLQDMLTAEAEHVNAALAAVTEAETVPVYVDWEPLSVGGAVREEV